MVYTYMNAKSDVHTAWIDIMAYEKSVYREIYGGNKVMFEWKNWSWAV